MWTFNYGEWSEAYVFLRLLGDGEIYRANEDFERDESAYMDVRSIIRHEKNHILQFDRVVTDAVVYAYDNGVLFKVMTCEELIEKADFLFEAIKNVSTADRKFSVPEIENYLKELRFSQPKVPKLPKAVSKQYGEKTDIIITVRDSLDRAALTEGYSIKSHLGGESTLFNAAQASKFRYEIVGCTDAEMNEINGNRTGSEIGMFEYIKNNPNLSLEFIGTSEAFKINLDELELTMVEIINKTILIQIGYYERAKSNKTKDLAEKLAEMNPIGVGRPNTWYKAKMKHLLFASFAGLTAIEPYEDGGNNKLSGGYINVNKSGEMLYYKAVSDVVFNSFLYEHTYFDRPGRGINMYLARAYAKARLEDREPTQDEIDRATYKLNEDGTFKLENGKRKKREKKGDWGYVIKEDGKYYIDINFQIRFT